MSLHVVLLKPAWTESVKPVQTVNNVLEIQISKLAVLNENERLAFLLMHTAKRLIPDCEESVKQGCTECSAAAGYLQYTGRNIKDLTFDL